MVYSESSKKLSSQTFRRPHGCAVLSINDVLQDRESSNDDREYTMKVYS